MVAAEIWLYLAAASVALFAGVVKGAVGFAMPMIMISGLASFMPAEQALVALILPTLLTNAVQALRQGAGEAWASVRDYKRMIATLVIFVLLTAQAVPLIPQAVLLGALGVPIVAFALTQLAGRQIRFDAKNRGLVEVLTGVVGGVYGGVSGVWGPPIIALLVSLEAEKRESVRVQGVVYSIGSVALLAGHLGSGVITMDRLGLSVWLLPPALAGLWFGFAIQDRLDARRFRRWTLVVLAITGLNLIRRALSV
ncbi:sulfite exporter TauE/SafE family protein [Albidovulum sediminicola]|uniref:Probable membrane transporter protein n=1 Tax=Albidovulum sediminicola TaxID=2984331 RepID=A0ABT2Z3B0_9RHOB|nr:sulfite exporter TauE/SafE family protein [Defluviimonas sp. WL0075]MCV2865639.1 sulfite exporter TauE/SafE family protein [Defluviimonas sp. WL0075]